MEKYKELQAKYTGNEGYQNALEQAKGSASDITAQQTSVAAAQDAARKAGYTKAQAAAIGAGRGADSYIGNYASNLTGQQSQAQGAGESAVSSQGNAVGNAQAQDQAEYDRKWGTAGKILETAGTVADVGTKIASGIELSDERGKIAETIANPSAMLARLGKVYQGKSAGDKPESAFDKSMRNLMNRKSAAPKEAVKEIASSMNDVTSDRRAKIYEEASPYKQYANLNSYLYKYKPEIVKKAKGKLGIDDKPHVGVMAQELEQNPVTAGTVHDNNGVKTVDTRQLTLANTATLADIAREVEKLKANKGA